MNSVTINSIKSWRPRSFEDVYGAPSASNVGHKSYHWRFTPRVYAGVEKYLLQRIYKKKKNEFKFYVIP